MSSSGSSDTSGYSLGTLRCPVARHATPPGFGAAGDAPTASLWVQGGSAADGRARPGRCLPTPSLLPLNSRRGGRDATPPRPSFEIFASSWNSRIVGSLARSPGSGEGGAATTAPTFIGRWKSTFEGVPQLHRQPAQPQRQPAQANRSTRPAQEECTGLVGPSSVLFWTSLGGIRSTIALAHSLARCFQDGGLGPLGFVLSSGALG